SRSFDRPLICSSSSILFHPTFLLSAPGANPLPRISGLRIVYSKSCTSSRSADQWIGCVCAMPNSAVVLRRPSGFCQTRASWWPSGWHEAQATQRRCDIGGLAVLNRILPRTHSGVLGGSHTGTVASFLRLASYTPTAKSSVL